jgi:hypothetical protein
LRETSLVLSGSRGILHRDPKHNKATISGPVQGADGIHIPPIKGKRLIVATFVILVGYTLLTSKRTRPRRPPAARLIPCHHLMKWHNMAPRATVSHNRFCTVYFSVPAEEMGLQKRAF